MTISKNSLSEKISSRQFFFHGIIFNFRSMLNLIQLIFYLFLIAYSTNIAQAVEYWEPVIMHPPYAGISDINDAGQVVGVGSYDGHAVTYLYENCVAKPLTGIYYINAQQPKINARGQVVWSAWDGNDREIFLYSDGQINNISSNDGDDREPIINDNGQVVWRHIDIGDMYHVYLYSNGVVNKISTDSHNNWNGQYKINNLGQVVWQGIPNGSNDDEILLYSDGTVDNISNNGSNDNSPDINNSGDIVWTSTGNNGFDIYTYINGVVQNFTNSDGVNDGLAFINDSGDIIWQIEDGLAPGHPSELYLYSNGTVKNISNTLYDDRDYIINNRGEVVWENYASLEEGWRIYLYSNGASQIISENSHNPKFNNVGQIVYQNHLDYLRYLANPKTLEKCPSKSSSPWPLFLSVIVNANHNSENECNKISKCYEGTFTDNCDEPGVSGWVNLNINKDCSFNASTNIGVDIIGKFTSKNGVVYSGIGQTDPNGCGSFALSCTDKESFITCSYTYNNGGTGYIPAASTRSCGE